MANISKSSLARQERARNGKGKVGATMFCKDGYRDYRCSIFTGVFNVLASAGIFLNMFYSKEDIFLIDKRIHSTFK